MFSFDKIFGAKLQSLGRAPFSGSTEKGKIRIVAIITSSLLIVGALLNLLQTVQAAASIVGTSTSDLAMANPSQKKAFFDTVNSKHWVFYYDGSAIKYDNSADGEVWSAVGNLPYDTPNFALTYKSISGTGYVFVAAECNAYDICVRKGQVGANSIDFSIPNNLSTAFDGNSSVDKYIKPSIALDADDSHVWISSIKSGDIFYNNHYLAYVNRSTNPADLSAWSGSGAVGNASGRLNDLVIMPQTGDDMFLALNGESQNIVGYRYDGSAWTGANTGGDYSWFNFGEGVNGEIEDIVINGSNIYVGGDFRDLGGDADADFIAIWDGSNWKSLGPVALNESVYALAISGSDLYVGGAFTNVGGNTSIDYIAKWDINNKSWSGLPNASFGSATTEKIEDIAISGSNMYIGGWFNDMGGDQNADYIVRWDMDNGTWHSLNSTRLENASPSSQNHVNAIAVSGQDVYVGGNFNDVGGDSNADRIIRWNESDGQWHALSNAGTPGGPNGNVEAITISDTEAYVGGAFTSIAGNASAKYIAKWDGVSWSALGNGGTGGPIYSIAVTDGVSGSGKSIYAGRSSTTLDLASRFDTIDSTWRTLGAGISPTQPYYIANTPKISAIWPQGNDIYFVGGYSAAGSNKSIKSFGLWNTQSQTWSTLGAGDINGNVYSIVASGSNVYVGGNFTAAGGDANANLIARWDGQWHALGTLPTWTSGMEVSSIAVYNASTIYVGFRETDGQIHDHYIASWNGSVWSTLGGSTNGNVRAVHIPTGGTKIYVGGDYTLAYNGPGKTNSVTNTRKIAYWDTADSQWHALGTGIPTGTNIYVSAIQIDGAGILYAGGRFFNAGDANGDYVARWTGAAWQSLNSTPLSNEVSSLAISGNDLYLGGSFLNVGGNSNADYVIRWNKIDTNWHMLGSSAPVSGSVASLTLVDNNLYAGGSFPSIGTIGGTSGIAVYNTVSETWGAVNNGLYDGNLNGTTSDVIWAIAWDGDSLFVGGNFVAFNQLENTSSQYIARLDKTIGRNTDYSTEISAASDAAGGIHLTYTDENDDLRYRKYDPSGNTWGTIVNLRKGSITGPSLSVNQASGDVYAFFAEDNKIAFKKAVAPYSLTDWDTHSTIVYQTGSNGNVLCYQEDGNAVSVLWRNGGSSPYNILYTETLTPLGYLVEDFIWDAGGEDDLWNNPYNWDTDYGWPDRDTDMATINIGSTDISTLNQSTIIGSLNLGSSYSGSLTLGNNLQLANTGGLTGNLAIGNALTTLKVDGKNFSVAGTVSNNGTIRFTGDETASFANGNDIDSGTIEYTAAAGSRNIGAWNYYNLLVNGNGQFGLAGNTDINGSLNIAHGTLNSNNQNIQIKGNWNNAGIFQAGNGTVSFNGGPVQEVNGTTTFNNFVSATTSSSRTLRFSGGSTQTVNGNWTITGGQGREIVLESSSQSNWIIDASSPTVTYVQVSRSTYPADNTPFCATYSVDKGGNANWQISDTDICPSITSSELTANSAQRKTFYDSANSRHWEFHYDNSVINYRYSITGNSNWTSPTASSLNYNTPNFALTYKNISNTGYVYLAAECNTSNICLQRGVMAANSIAFDPAIEVFTGGGKIKYLRPTVSLSNDNHLWVASIKDIGIEVNEHLQVFTRKSSNAANQSLASWGDASVAGRAASKIKDLVVMPQGASGMYLLVSPDTPNIMGYKNEGSGWQEATSGGDYSWLDFSGETAGTINAIAISGTDVYVGGNFIELGGVDNANNIARWDSSTSTWNALGTGVDNDVYTVGALGTEIYVGGLFTSAGGIASTANFAYWSTTAKAWNSAGTINDDVRNIFIDGNNVYVGGKFTSVNSNTELDLMARWDASARTWNKIGDGFSSTYASSNVYSIQVSGNDLYAAGYFTDVNGDTQADGLVHYDGRSWSNVGNFSNNGVLSLLLTDNKLYVGGDFPSVGGNTNCSRIARWNIAGSSWECLGAGVNNSVWSIAPGSNGDVYIGGKFLDAGGTGANYIAKWNEGTGWGSFDNPLTISNAAVKAIVAQNGNYYMGGDKFEVQIAGSNKNASGIALWDGANWNALRNGFSASSIGAIQLVGNDVYIGGEFTNAEGLADADNIIKWDSTALSWSALGTGLDDGVYDMAVLGNNLYVGGLFSTASGVANTNTLAYWDLSGGTGWHAVGNIPLDGYQVNALAVANNKLYVGGDFYQAGGVVNASYLAIWDESSGWQAVSSDELDYDVTEIAISGNNVYVSGLFEYIGSNPYNYIAYFDGSIWHNMGSGLQSNASSIAISANGNVYAGGQFTSAGGDASIRNLARWDGSSWHAVGGSALNGSVSALKLIGTDLYLAGNFSNAGLNGTDRGLARWDTTNLEWKNLDTNSVSIQSASAISNSGDKIYLGGLFNGVFGSTNFTILTKTVAADVNSNSMISAVSDNSGNIHLLYNNTNGVLKYRSFDSTTNEWTSAITIRASGAGSPTISIDLTTGDLYSFWIESNSLFYKKGISPFGGSEWGSVETLFNSGSNINLTSDYQSGDGKIKYAWTSNNGSTNLFKIDALIIGEGEGDLFNTITSSAGPGGTITPAGTATVPKFSNTTYTITPNLGYRISDVKVDNVSVGTVSTYQFTNISTNHTIVAEFTINKYQIVAEVEGEGGSIALSSNEVNYGGSVVITLTPQSGYYVASLRDNGSPLSINLLEFTIAGITADHLITVSFEKNSTTTSPITYTVRVVTDENVLVTPGTLIVVNEGENLTLNFSVKKGFYINQFLIDGSSIAFTNTYTFSKIAQNHEVIIRSKAQTPAGEGGDDEEEIKEKEGQPVQPENKPSQYKEPAKQIGEKHDDKSVFLGVASLITILLGLAANPFANLTTLFSAKEFIKLPLLYFYRRKKNKWGRIVEAHSLVPLSGAEVSLVKSDIGGETVISTTFSDREGNYAFAALPGNYKIEVRKENFHPVKLNGFYSSGSILEIKNQNEGLVNVDVVLELDGNALDHKIKVVSSIRTAAKISNILSILLTIAGSIFALINIKNAVTPLNIAIIVFYMIVWAYFIRGWLNKSPWGKVITIEEHKPLPFALIRVTDIFNNLKMTVVSNETGKFSTILGSGSFNLYAYKQGYEMMSPAKINSREKINIVNTVIEMQRVE